MERENETKQSKAAEAGRKADDQVQLERGLLDALTEGEIEALDPEQAARKLLPPRYEVRIQSTWDPIVEETQIYRSMAKEVDDRYDRYLAKLGQGRQAEGTARAGQVGHIEQSGQGKQEKLPDEADETE